MKSIIKIFLFLIALVFMIECEPWDGVEFKDYGELRILEEDRFVFNRDDTLLYRCSDGSFDTVCVKNATFYTSRKTDRSPSALGGTTVTIYTIDIQKVIIETFNKKWLYY